jgi:8-oxo-dGTP diphosphatase
MEPKLFAAAKAFIEHGGKVLIIRESEKYKVGTQTGKYDVIGGRIKPGEKVDESLLREVKEETSLGDVKIGPPFFVNESHPLINGGKWHIIRIFFKCSTDSDKVVLSRDHDDFIWIDPKDYRKYNIIDNLFPAFESYIKG